MTWKRGKRTPQESYGERDLRYAIPSTSMTMITVSVSENPY